MRWIFCWIYKDNWIYEDYENKEFYDSIKDYFLKLQKALDDEARTAIHAETEGLVDNAQRMEKPICKSVDLDFKVDGPAPYTHMDAKHPVGSEILKKQGQTSDIKTMAEKVGEAINDQKERFCGLEQGPENSENVLHIVDLAYVPSHEKEIVKEYLLKGAGSSEGIKFLNEKLEMGGMIMISLIKIVVINLTLATIRGSKSIPR